MNTLNIDIVSVAHRLNRFIVEIQKSASANVAKVEDFDLTRYKSYLSALRYLITHVTNDPRLDLPETNPTPYSVRDTPGLLDVENESVQHLCLLLKTAKDELMMSASSRQSTGINQFDKARFLAVVDKAELYLSEYVSNALPIDLPESSPRADLQGPGLTGNGA